MNNEIKEILEQLEWYRKIGKKDVYYPEYVLPNKKAFILLDYITNLQHQISLMEEDIRESKEINGELQQDNEKIGKLWREEEAHCILLQQENEYLKKTNDEKTKIGIADHKYSSQMEDKVIELQQENGRLQENNQAMQEEMARVWEENEKLKEEKQRLLYNLEKVCEEDATTNN